MNKEYIDKFEEKLQGDLLRLCSVYKELDGKLLACDDIDNKWSELAPEYIADAVGEIENYPVVSVSWAAYLGMAIACGWDKDWKICSKAEYKSFYGEEGFDNMDEHIVKDVLGHSLDSDDAKQIESIIRRCGEATVSFIRHENIEPQSKTAFYAFAAACRVMYRIGAAIKLKRMGYNFEKVQL